MGGDATMNGKYAAYPEYKDSEIEVIGNVPKDWVVGRLKQIVDQNRQITYGIVQAGPNKKDGIPYIRPADMTEEGGVKSYEDLLQTSPEIAADYERSKIKPGDIICSIGPSFGKLMITPERLDGANLTQGTARVAISSTYNARYFFWALRSTSSFQQWESSVGGATFRALNLGPLADTFVVVPTGEEQQKIANFLDHETAKIDTLIEKQQRLIKLLKEKRQAVISHAVTKGLNPNAPMRDSGVEWLGEVPEDWMVCKIKQVARLESGHTPDKKVEAYWVNCDIPWVSLNDSAQLKQVDYITETAFYLNDKGIENSSARNLPERCVVFTRDASIGLAAITTRVMAVSQHVIAWVCDEEKVIPEYLLLVFYAMKEELDRYTAGATLKTIGLPDVNKLSGAFPSVDEQRALTEHAFREMENFDLLISKAGEVVGIMQERRTALISAAVTGKIDVRNWRAA